MIPLILIWFGIGMWSKVFIVFISAFFPILVNTVGGMRAIDRDLLRAARAFCAPTGILLILLRPRYRCPSSSPASARVSPSV